MRVAWVVVVALISIGGSIAISGTSIRSVSAAPSLVVPPPLVQSETPNPVVNSTSPHPGTIDSYEVAPDGATTTDPAVAYDSVSEEPILNVYQTLVAYDGNSTSNFVPEIATCVPGSAECAALYGSSLVTDNLLGEPTYFTFAIDPAAHFYDPSTGASWPVFPSDVVFSFARTMIWSEYPGVGITGGWIQTQALLPFGDSSWDGGLHAPYNNTPQNVLGSMLVNDSAYCPTAALAASGCITFSASGSDQDWPYFLQLIADDLGGGVVPCGWFTAQGASVPGFTGTSVANGDGPCLLPGGATSTSDSSFRSWLNTTSPTAWDSTIQEMNNYPAPQPGVRWSMVGSGPYYLVPGQIDPAVGYELRANPDFHAPTGCVGQPNCQPALGTYQNTVNVYWETSDTLGIQEYIAGQADLATLLITSTSSLLQLEQQGKIWYTTFPTLSIFFNPATLNFSVSAEQVIDPNPGQLNIPGDFFSGEAVRQLMVNSWDYQTVENTINTVDGIQFFSNYGGAIPIGMGDYYPQNISWPAGDAVTDPSIAGSAAWWWVQGTNASSPYYDAELAACTASNPCKFPVIGELGSPNLDAAYQLWIASVARVTGGAVVPYTFDLSFNALVEASVASGPGTSPLPWYTLGWAPDYPDPTDYVTPMYLPNSTYTNADSLYQSFASPSYNLDSCGHDALMSYADLVYWANLPQLSQGCQGIAYSVMVSWFDAAASLPTGAQRTRDYNLAEHIANLLALYVYWGQTNAVVSGASWIDPSSINENPMTVGDALYYNLQYVPVPATTAVTFSENGLPSGTSWSVQLGAQSLSSTTSTITFNVTLGNYSYQLPPAATDWVPVPPSGSLNVTGPTSVSVHFVYAPNTVFFTESGLPAGSSWTVDLGGVIFSSQAPTIALSVPLGTISYSITGPSNYRANPVNGTIDVTGRYVSYGIQFTPITYAVSFQETGLPAGTTWAVSFGGVILGSNTSTITFQAFLGNYTWYVGFLPGFGSVTESGTTTVTSSGVTITIAFSRG